MKDKLGNVLWNKYSRAIGIGMASLAVLAGAFEKKSATSIAVNAAYFAGFGIIFGAVINAIKTNGTTTPTA